MSDKLTEIMAWKRQEIAALVRPVSESELSDLNASLPKPPSLATALRRPDGKLAVIAEGGVGVTRKGVEGKGIGAYDH